MRKKRTDYGHALSGKAEKKSRLISTAKPRLLGSAMVLAAGSIVAKILGALYRIPLTNILGAEGMGMYQLIFPVFALFMVFSTAGIPTALSRIVAEKRALGEDGKKYLGVAVCALLAFCALSTLLVLALANLLAGWQGNPEVALGYRIIAPSILFIGVIAALRGWFQGEMYMLPTAISNIVEQLVKLAVGIGFSVALLPYGTIAAVAGALAGVTFSEVVATIYLVATYFIRQRKADITRRGFENAVEADSFARENSVVAGDSFVRENSVVAGDSLARENSVVAGDSLARENSAVSTDASERKKRKRLRVTAEEARQMLVVAFPIALVAILLPLSNFFDSLIIVNVLKWRGEATSIATANYGLLSGPVTSLINMPVVVIMSLAVAIVPSVSASRVERDINSIISKSRLSIKLAYMIGVPSAAFMMVFSKQIVGVLYPALGEGEVASAAALLLITAPNIVLLAAMQIYVSLLQALDRTKFAVKSLVCAIMIKIVLSVVLVRFIGINGAATASLIMGIVALALTNIFFLRLTSLRLEKNVGITLFSGMVACLASIVPAVYISNAIVALVVGFVLCYIIYFWLIVLFGLFEKNEFASLPFGKIMARLHRVIRFWEYGEKNDA